MVVQTQQPPAPSFVCHILSSCCYRGHGSASEMTCIVSSGALNSTHSLTPTRTIIRESENKFRNGHNDEKRGYQKLRNKSLQISQIIVKQNYCKQFGTKTPSNITLRIMQCTKAYQKQPAQTHKTDQLAALGEFCVRRTLIALTMSGKAAAP